MELNQELNGVELYFEDKPPQTILSNLKENRFRWSNNKKCWYAKQSPNTLKIAQELSGEVNQESVITDDTNQTTTTKTTKTQNKILPLWNLTRWTELEVNSKQSNKEIAAEVRKHVRNRFPMVKFSVTNPHHSSISFYIVSSPYEKESIYLEAIKEYCTNLLKAYKYCTCHDPYGDYGSSYNFYGGNAEIDYQYIQTEQTEAITADIEDFNTKLAEFEQSEEVRKEEKHQNWLKLQEEQKESDRKCQIESARQIEIINNSVEVKPLEETEQYFVVNSQFAKCNKNQRMSQYVEEVTAGEFYLENVKIQKEIHFTNEEALNYFHNHFLTNFDFLEQTGGSYTDDPRIQMMMDYEQMTKEERETVVFNLYGVAVYYNEELQFVIDAQGYSYARYVGLIDNNTKVEKTITADPIYTPEQLEDLKAQAETLTDFSLEAITCEPNITATWNTEDFTEYKTRMKQIFNKNYFKLTKPIVQQIIEDQHELKSAMYRLLKEVDGIQDQFQNANLQQNQKYTLIYMSDWGGMITSKITFDHFECCKYAQYDKAVKIVFKPEKKRGLYSTTKYDELLVYPGWLDLPTQVLHTVENTGTCTVTSSKFLSCDKRQYDEVINYFAKQGITPLINTYKPIF